MSDTSSHSRTIRKPNLSSPPGWMVVGFVLGVIVTGILCGTLILLDVPAYLNPTATPTATPTFTPTPVPTSTPTPTITPMPMTLDFGWSGVTWELPHDNPAIAVGTLRLLIGGGFQPYAVLHNGRKVTATNGVFYVTVQTPACEPVTGTIEVHSADGQRVVRNYELSADEVPCPTSTPKPES